LIKQKHLPAIEYQQAVAFLDDLIDEVGEDETHPLASLMELLGTLVEEYETQHVPELQAESLGDRAKSF